MIHTGSDFVHEPVYIISHTFFSFTYITLSDIRMATSIGSSKIRFWPLQVLNTRGM